MRVVEPHHFKNIKKKKKKQLPAATLLLPIGLFALIILYVLFGQQRVHGPAFKDETQKPDSSQASESQKEETPLTLKQFTDEQFKDLYTSFAYPNTQQLVEPPVITGNAEADARIQQLATERGYKLSSVPVASIVRIDEPYLTEDDLLQQNAKIGWDGLQLAAEQANIPLQITSAYRSIEFQRSVFLQRMRDAGITAPGIADGFSDAAINAVMDQVAPPGFSRHHTGYTIDLACSGIGLYGFKNTTCYTWISNNNFEIAKTHGWVPSYPEEAELQGPEPEPWEFIWVGTINLYE